MFHPYWPPLTALALFVIGSIILVLKYGPKLCKARHEPRPSDDDDWEGKTYEQKVSFA
ncbi:uncharacterized protein LOC124159498 [Ischnura elegans]|uniref:uncharacterized protein LOC124159498 n=1 Tax=Ischnura elegans TaxID=197161 RepID=UPI001ED8B8D8|nr:uncharacterized protein LOC124159498 [Ischnura elegans]